MIDNHDFTLYKICFTEYHNGLCLIQAKSWNKYMTFIGNKAPFGRAIFATPLYPCQLIQESKNHYLSVNASRVFSICSIHVNESEVAMEGALHREHDTLYAILGSQYNHGVR